MSIFACSVNCPIGFAMDHYILRDQLMAIDRDHRGIALLYAAVVDPADEAALAGVCNPLLPEEIPLEDDLSAVVANQSNYEGGVRCRIGIIARS